MFSSAAIQVPISLEKKLDKTNMRTNVASLMARCQVPGIAIGIYLQDEIFLEGFGVTSLDNPLPVRPTTLLFCVCSSLF